MRSGFLSFVVTLGLSVSIWAADAQPGVEQPKVTSVKSHVGALAYSIPAAKLSGDLRPSAGSHLMLVEVVLGGTAFKADPANLKLMAEGGETYSPIAIGGTADQIVPLDRLEVGQNVGVVHPGGAMFLLRKNKEGVTVSIDQKATFALVYETPIATTANQLRIGEVSIPLRK